MVEMIKERLGDIDGNQGVIGVDEFRWRQFREILQKYHCFIE